MSKRYVAEASDGGPAPKRIQLEQVNLGPIGTLTEMETKTLIFQNKKLAQRLEQQGRTERGLKQRIEELEKRQMQDDALLNVVNRYWNQLNEDIRVLLLRFDSGYKDTEDEDKSEPEGPASSFLAQLASLDSLELDSKLSNRVQTSRHAVARILEAFENLLERQDKLASGLSQVKEEKEEGGDDLDGLVKTELENMKEEHKRLHCLTTSLHQKHHAMSLKVAELGEKLVAAETECAELRVRLEEAEYERDKCTGERDKMQSLLVEAREQVKSLQVLCAENQDSQSRNGPHAKNLSTLSQKKLEELQHELEEQRELASGRMAELEKLHANHKEALQTVEKLKMEIKYIPESTIQESVPYKTLQSNFSVLYNEFMNLKTEYDNKCGKLHLTEEEDTKRIALMENEELMCQKKLRAELMQLEDMLAQVRKEYEMLRIEFEQNLAANEQTGPINREMRHLITSLQNHNHQLKGEIQRGKKRHRELSNELAKARKEIEDLRAQVAQQKLGAKKLSADGSSGTLVNSGGANGPGPHDVGSGPSHRDKQPTQQQNCTGDSTPSPVVHVKQESFKSEHPGANSHNGEGREDGGNCKTTAVMDTKVKQEFPSPPKQESHRERELVKKELHPHPHAHHGHSPHGNRGTSSAGMGKDRKPHGLGPISSASFPSSSSSSSVVDSDLVRDLKAQLKKSQSEQKEMKLLLDMYKGVAKDQRDKVQLMAAERKARMEVDELKLQLKKFQDARREERRKLADEDAMRKIRQLEEQVHHLQKMVASHKQEEAALLNEMEVTGQAFEDMQEQNARLIKQLKEKDDANMKLMGERIKSNQINKLGREEKDMLVEQVKTLTTQLEAQRQVVVKLEEKEGLLQASLISVEKEVQLRTQAAETHKRKALEAAQSAYDLNLHLKEYQSQIGEAQTLLGEKTAALERENFRLRRVQEEVAALRRRLERAQRMELAGTADEVLQEEVREYKEQLTCPSCKVKKKDAVLTKCFHVFCFDCLRTRYETRQRKCPKCNAAFGANDYHRLYLS